MVDKLTTLATAATGASALFEWLAATSIIGEAVMALLAAVLLLTAGT
jgi:ABC-type multidrug transport system permease subunit